MGKPDQADIQPAMRVFAERLKEAMYEEGYTQAALSETLGVSTQTLHNWRHAIHKIGVEHMGRLSETLGWTPEELWPGWDEIRHDLRQGGPRVTIRDLEKRIAALEAEVAELKGDPRQRAQDAARSSVQRSRKRRSKASGSPPAHQEADQA